MLLVPLPEQFMKVTLFNIKFFVDDIAEPISQCPFLIIKLFISTLFPMMVNALADLRSQLHDHFH